MATCDVLVMLHDSLKRHTLPTLRNGPGRTSSGKVPQDSSPVRCHFLLTKERPPAVPTIQTLLAGVIGQPIPEIVEREEQRSQHGQCAEDKEVHPECRQQPLSDGKQNGATGE